LPERPLSPQEVGSLVSFIGTVTQLGGALLLAAFFLLLRGHAARRPYFRAWSVAWAWMSLALVAVFSLYQFLGEGSARPVWFVYQASKLAFLSSLLAGALAYALAVKPRAILRLSLPLSAAYAGLSVLLAPDFNGVVAMQGPVAAVVLGMSAWTLLRLPKSRATLGSRATGSFFALMAALWVFYAVTFDNPDRLTGVVQFIIRHNSYLDLLLQMLLGYGMVVLLMEDAKREVDAAHAALALAHDELKRQAVHDSLTGVMNRRAWTEGIGLEAVRASVGAAVMLDVDNLKPVNDTHGHAAGDELLRRVADVLRQAVRPGDRLYRWGGDEFLLLLPGARAADARRRVEELVAEANAALPPESAERLSLQVSIGAAEFSGGEALGLAVSRADAAMYQEKSRHRASRAPVRA
jgi:diguanylate cyclase (GGDEF)-like protein